MGIPASNEDKVPTKSISIVCPNCGNSCGFHVSDLIVQNIIGGGKATLPCGHVVLRNVDPVRLENDPLVIVIPVREHLASFGGS